MFTTGGGEDGVVTFTLVFEGGLGAEAAGAEPGVITFVVDDGGGVLVVPPPEEKYQIPRPIRHAITRHIAKVPHALDEAFASRSAASSLRSTPRSAADWDAAKFA
jgi:hypothetical protein